MRDERDRLVAQSQPESLDRSHVLRHFDGLARIGEIEHSIELGREDRAVGTRAAQRLLQPAQRVLVAVEQLDFQLPEAARHPLVVEHGNRVVDHLDASGANDLPAGPQPRHRHERLCTQECR